MPTYYARKAGNINAADVWATTPAGTAAAVTFASGDVLMANSFTITVNVNTTVAEVRNDTTGGATLGGSFSLGAGVLLKANIFSAYFSNGAACVSSVVTSAIEGNITVTGSGGASSQLNRAVIFNGAAGANLSITGNIIIPSAFTHIRAVDFQGTGGNLIITGNLIGNSSSGNNAVSLATFSATSTGSITIVGNITAGSSNGLDNTATNVPVAVTGTVTGGNTGLVGISNQNTSPVTVTGTVTGGVGGAGVSNSSTGTIRVTRAVGNAYGPGNTSGLIAAVGAANVGLGVIEIEQLEYGTFGQTPTSGTGIRLRKLGSNVAVFNYVDSGAAKTLVDATQANQPAVTDVRSGVSYASGALTGTCAVPAAGSVALGVPVGSTTGTALLTGAAVASAVWDALTSSLTTSGSIGERIKNCSTAEITGEQLAAALSTP